MCELRTEHYEHCDKSHCEAGQQHPTNIQKKEPDGHGAKDYRLRIVINRIGSETDIVDFKSLCNKAYQKPSN